MSLAEYTQKRRFDRTPEPAAKVAPRPGQLYLIQKHAASHLHYDFRLELDGVLKSWAVPKGPSLDPSVKRLAVHVEDHPVEYGKFEGVIPEGEYGGGTVMLWDTGEWEPVGDPHEGYRQGKLKFQLHGEKLNGGWSLIRTHSPTAGKHPQWLLIKEKDAQAQPVSKGDVLVESPLSVASGRDLDEIASSRAKVWSSQPLAKKSPATRQSKTVASKPASAAKSKQVSRAVKQPMPAKIPVQLATLAQAAPPGDEWLHEVKFDGYRMVCRIDGKQVKFLSRNDLDWTARVGVPSAAVQKLPVKQAIIDGEVVVMNADGTTDFQALQNAFRDGRGEDLQYYVFDLLYLNGKSLTEVPLEERKVALQKLVSDLGPDTPIHYSEHIVGSGEKFQQEACRLNLEGSIAKLRNQPYRPGRGYDWLKIKCVGKDEFVIGGYTDPSGSRTGFGALLMGYYDADKKLHYAGKVGTGFDDRELQSLSAQLQSLEVKKSPFVDRTEKVGDIRTAHWVKPTLVAQISFGSRTRDGILRHASYTGLREDKPAKDVKLDEPIPVEKAIEKVARQTAPQEDVEMVESSAPDSKKSKPAKKSTKAARADQPRETQIRDQSEYDTNSESFAGVRLTHPEKLLYPDEGITKLELATYYRDVAEWLLPHIKHRPVVLVRCPDGQNKACFYQKHPGAGTPDNLRQIPIRESTKTENYVLIDDVGGLISLAQISALEIHAWGSLEDKLERPNQLIFDLDPSPEVPWVRVVESARHIRQFLTDLGLVSFVKTTGGKGLHIVVPIERRHDWEAAKAFSKGVADAIVAVAPDQYTSNMSKAGRTNKIFLDYLRNARGATAVAPFSPRSRPGAPVSMPLHWDELSEQIPSDHFTIRDALDWLAKVKDDPWKELRTVRQSLSTPIKTLKKLGVLR